MKMEKTLKKLFSNCPLCGKGIRKGHWKIEKNSLLGFLYYNRNKVLSKLGNKLIHGMFYREYDDRHYQIICFLCKSLSTVEYDIFKDEN